MPTLEINATQPSHISESDSLPESIGTLGELIRERGCVENQPQHIQRAAADALRTAALRVKVRF